MTDMDKLLGPPVTSVEHWALPLIGDIIPGDRVILSTEKGAAEVELVSKDRSRETLTFKVLREYHAPTESERVAMWRERFSTAARAAGEASARVADLDAWLDCRRKLDLALATYRVDRDPRDMERAVVEEIGAYLNALGSAEVTKPKDTYHPDLKEF